MVSRGFLEVKVAVPCDGKGNPIEDDSLFHEKTRDHRRPRRRQDRVDREPERGPRRAGNTTGRRSTSTEAGAETAERIDEEEKNFARLWANRPASVIVIDVPEAARRDLMRFMPNEGLARTAETEGSRKEVPEDESGSTKTKPAPEREPPAPVVDRRSLVWTFIKEAPTLPGGGALVGEATAAVTPWPHQVRAFERLYGQLAPEAADRGRSRAREND